MAKVTRTYTRGHGAVQLFIESQGGIRWLDGLMIKYHFSVPRVVEHMQMNSHFQCDVMTVRNYLRAHDRVLSAHGGDRKSQRFKDKRLSADGDRKKSIPD